MQRIAPLDDAQVVSWEERLEAQMVESLQGVMDTIAARIAKIQVASAWLDVARIEVDIPLRALIAAVTTGPDGDDLPPPMTGELAIPDPPILPEVLPDTPALPPGQSYISPDDLASIAPLWQQAVEQQLLPLVAQVFIDSAGNIRSQLLESVAPNVTVAMPRLGSMAAEQYLRGARKSFDEIGDHLWETARAQMSQGFDAGESIPQIADRLRQSAGLTARQGVLVARTSVIEASNSGSLQMAQASGLQMQKEWIATPDLRTRPTHLAADGQRVDLNEPFIVGGFSAMFPAAPTLPPSERYRCRCTQGYVMPDKPKTQPSITPPAQDAQLAELPGTSGLAAEIEAPPLGEILPKVTGPGFDLPAYGEHPPSYVRPSLQAAKTPRELRRVWQDEVRAITGFPFAVDAMPRGISMVTAREYAEGTLQMFAQFPGARVDRIHWFDDAASSSYAQVRRGGHAIEFNMRYASEKGRPQFLAARRRDAAGWDTGPTSWGVRNDMSAQGVVYHEFTHILDLENTRESLHSGIVPLLIQHAQREGITDIDDMIKRQISSYATKNYQEMIAEAGADVMVNGAAASQLSRDIFGLLRAEYRRRGFEIRTGPALPEDIGEVFPKVAAPRTVAELATETPVRVTPLEGGLTARVERLDYEDGQSAVRKDYGRPDAADQRTAQIFAEHAVKTEDLAADVLRVVGVRHPDVVRLNDHAILMDFVEGQQGGETGVLSAPAAIVRSIEGRRLGLADALTGHRDRGGGNWMRAPDDGIVAIDNGGAFLGSERAAAGNPFTSFLMGKHAESPWKAKIEIPESIDLAEIRRGLLALRPKFEDLGYRRQFKDMTDRLDEIERRAVRVPDPPSLVREVPKPTPPVVKPAIAAPRALSSQTVAQLRALAKERGITVPPGTRKADLVKMLEEAPAAPAVVVDELAAIELRVRAAYDRLAAEPGRFVTLADLRDALPGEDRSKLDEVLVLMNRRKGIRVVPESNQKVLTPRERAAEVQIGNQRRHAIAIEADAEPVPGIPARGFMTPTDVSVSKAQQYADDLLQRAAELQEAGGSAKAVIATFRAKMRFVRLQPVDIDGNDLVGTSPARAVRYEWRQPNRTVRLDRPPPAEMTADELREFAEAQKLSRLSLAVEDAARSGSDISIAARAAVRDVSVPVEAPPLSRAPLAYQARQAELREAAARPVIEGKSRRMSGESAYTTRVEHEGGPPTITKDYTRQNETLAQGKRSADAEELGALVDDAVGLRAPTVIRTGPRSIEESFLEGQNGEEILPWPHTITDELIGSDDGRLIGLSDILVGESDRNAGNFIRLADGRLASIDRGGAFQTPKLAGAQSPFAQTFAPEGKWAKSIDIAPQDLAVIRARLEALRPEFERLGRATWHKQVMTRLAEVEKRADPAAAIRLAEARADLSAITSPVGRVDIPTPIAVKGYETRARRLRELYGEKPISETSLSGGHISTADLVTTREGRFVVKDSIPEREGGPVSFSGRTSEQLTDAEVLGSEVFDAVGARAPAAIKISEQRSAQEFIEGRSGTEVALGRKTIDTDADQAVVNETAARLAETDEGRLRGLAQAILGDGDSNSSNWIVDADGHLWSIDHGGASFAEDSYYGLSNAWTRQFLDQAKRDGTFAEHALSPSDMAIIRTRLAKLEPKFAELGRQDWFEAVMRRVDALSEKATGTRSILVEARPDIATPTVIRAAQRAEVRARAAAVAAQRGNAALLARVDELIQAKASKAVIRQELDPALREAEQLYAGADDAVATALRDALDSGDAAKIRAALTRQTKASGLTPIGKAGAKAKFDPATMEGVGGTAIPDGADVIVVRRGAKLAGIETPEKAVVRLDRPPVAEFEPRKAKPFKPTPLVKRARIVEKPPAAVTTIDTPTGSYTFKGTYVEVLDDQGRVSYGADYKAWLDENERVSGDATGWRKIAPVDAYRYAGATPRTFQTRVPGTGVVEKEAVARKGDWIVRQKRGEVQVISDEEFQRRYLAQTTQTQYAAKIKAAAKKQEALDAVPAGMSYVPATEPGEFGRTVWRNLGGPATQDALQEYTAFGFQDSNDALRLLTTDSTQAGRIGRDLTRKVDRAFDQSRLSADVELWRSPGSGRGIFGDPGTWGDDLAGFEWADSAYSSTSASRTVADRFVKDHGVRLRILAPQGSKAVQLSTLETGEAEVLLARGARFRVVKDRGWTEITHPTTHKRIRIRDLDVEVTVPDVTPPLPWETK